MLLWSITQYLKLPVSQSAYRITIAELLTIRSLPKKAYTIGRLNRNLNKLKYTESGKKQTQEKGEFHGTNLFRYNTDNW